MAKSNARRNVRVDCAATARAEGPKGPVKGTCRSISQGGLYFLGLQVPIGNQVDLTVDLPNIGTIQATGEVRYHRVNADGPGMGIRFTRLGADDLARIIRFIGANG